MALIKFTPAQARAVMHRLCLCDVFAEVFADSPELAHLATGAQDRARAMALELDATNSIASDRESELDGEILAEAIEGSTYVACHGDYVPQRRAARVALKDAARVVEVFYNMDRGGLEVPTQ